MLTLDQPSATRPLFGTNLHFGHLPQNFNLSSWLSVLTNWLKWRFVPKMGRVADGWLVASQKTNTSHDVIFCNHLTKLLQQIVASQKTNISHDVIFCNHLAKLLQQIVAYQKTSTSRLSFVIILQSCYNS